MANLTDYTMRWREHSVGGITRLIPDPCGEFVKFEDHAKRLQTVNQQLKAAILLLEECSQNLGAAPMEPACTLRTGCDCLSCRVTDYISQNSGC